MRVDDAGSRAGQRMRDRYDGQIPPPLLPRPKRRGVARALVAAVLVAVLVVGVVVITRPDDRHGPARGPHVRWDRTSLHRAFGGATVMSDVVGAPWGFVASGGTSHRCESGAASWACQTSHLWYSARGEHWTEISLPAVRAAQSDVELGRVGNRVLAIWTLQHGLAAWWSSNGRDWHRSTVHQPRLPASSLPTFSSWDIGTWSGGVVASDIQDGITSWVSRNGSAWRYVDADAGSRNPTFLWPQGVRVANSWIGITGGRGVISNGASEGIPQIMQSSTGRGWQPIASNAPERLLPRLVPDASDRFVVAAQFRIPGVAPQAVGLYQTTDGHDWVEIESLRRQFPDANPSEIAQSRGWWIVSGTDGPSGAQSTAVWISRDLKHWDSAPQHPGRFGAPGMLATSRSIALALPSRGRWIRIIHLS